MHSYCIIDVNRKGNLCWSAKWNFVPHIFAIDSNRRRLEETLAPMGLKSCRPLMLVVPTCDVKKSDQIKNIDCLFEDNLKMCDMSDCTNIPMCQYTSSVISGNPKKEGFQFKLVQSFTRNNRKCQVIPRWNYFSKKKTNKKKRNHVYAVSGQNGSSFRNVVWSLSRNSHGKLPKHELP